ncbi:hypothetical protein EW145_g5546 [Phellinidium pouzarii]|uniref:Uncharacterized protein n=1 Tax=Phellinidium pouzarii TaxID=167371 RepID=A0A4S4KZS4_9AGAM|nr:hypothetical protein EW145_g5546 [Phellinidium pouzarii]
MFSKKTRHEISLLTSTVPAHASHWNGVWLSIVFELFVEPQTRAWYSIQPWPRDRHAMYVRRTSALTVVRHNLDLSEGVGTNPAPVSDVQGVVLIDYLNTPDWGDGQAVKGLEERMRSQAEYTLGMNAGEYAYGNKALYFVMGVGPHWRYGVRDAQGFRYLCKWHNRLDDVDAYVDFLRLVELVEQL